jgi:hypothetical protein
MPEQRKDFVHPRVLLCEGPDDVVFFERLIEVWNLPRFHVRHTGGSRSDAGGNTKFGDALRLLKNNDRFRIIRHVVLASDNDLDQEASFKKICVQVELAGFGPAPNSPSERSKATHGASPSITIVMLPLEQHEGTLECLCETAAREADKQVGFHVDHFAALLHADQWSVSRRGKMWLRTSLLPRVIHNVG